VTWEQIDYKFVTFDVMDVRITPDGTVHYADSNGALHIICKNKTFLCECRAITDTLWKPKDAIGQRTAMISNILFVYRQTGVLWRCDVPGRVVSYALPKQGHDVYLASFEDKSLYIFEIKTSM
jgi:hypothetical protein